MNWLFAGITNTLKNIDTKSNKFRNYLTWASIGALSLSIITYITTAGSKGLLTRGSTTSTSPDVATNTGSEESTSASKIRTKVGSKGVYVGEYNDQKKKHGQGKFTFENGDIYDGNWRENKRHGSGKYQWAKGNIYHGDWVEDKREGKGKMEWPDGSCYEGDFGNSMFHGNGVFRFADGSEYTGEWKNDKKNGQGNYRFASGNVYVGKWLDGKEHGQGKVSFQDGSSYEGEFYAGKFHGKGIKRWPDDGTVYNGVFKNGKFHGQATVTYAVDDPTGQQRFFAGDVYEGEFADGHKNGKGLMRDKNGKVYQKGIYKGGKFVGS